MKRAHSELFSPYRFAGVVTANVPPSVRSTFVGKKSMLSILCPIDNVIVQYNGQKMRAIGVSDPLKSKISAITSSSSCVYAAAGNNISVLPFCRDVSQEIHVENEILQMLLIGNQLVYVDTTFGIGVIDTEEEYRRMIYMEGSDDFKISTITHPSTYLNKILVASEDGRLRLINFRSGKVIHEFQKSYGSAVKVLEQTTALDVIAVGLEDGQVILHNVKTDKILHKYKHDSEISSIAFRNDGTASMVTTDINGTIAVWDLDKQELIGKITKVHSAAVNLLYFVPGEPIMVSASHDNSLRTWIFDGADGMPRELVQLEGHARPITDVRFASKHHILSSGLDGSVRKYDVTSLTMRHKLGTAALMSKANAKKKGVDFEAVRLENVVEMAVGWQREAAWDNVVCRHKDTLPVTTWTTRNNCAGSIKLEHERFKKDAEFIGTTATSICLSPCGNFVFIGYSSGHLDKFNVQSGRHIHSFTEEKRKTVKSAKGPKYEIGNNRTTAHTSPITALTIDQRGSELASGCESGTMKFWNLATNRCVYRLKTPSLEIKKAVSSPTNSLISVGCRSMKDGSAFVAIIDSICHRIVRSFSNVGAKINAMEFSSDGKWLLIADDESYIRVFDVATSNLIDVLLFAKPCVSIAFNPTGEFLATAHKDEKAVYIWANKALFLAHVNIQALDADYVPTWDSIENQPDVFIDDDEDSIADDDLRAMRELQIDEALVTYSGLAPSRWANLPDLAVIKERNKPTDAPRKIKQAPFFLTAAPTLEGFEFENNDFDLDENMDSKIIETKRNLLELESSFTALLRNSKTEADLLSAFNTLKEMSISAIDFQLRSLSTSVLATFFRMLLEVMKTRKDFELVQAYLTTAIKIHRNDLWKSGDGDEEMSDVLQQLFDCQAKCWNDYEELLVEDMAVVQWIKNALL